MTSELTIREELTGGQAKVYVAGEVDIYTSRQFKDKLYNIIDSTKSDLYVDCTDLNYIDSTGLGIFVGALKKTKQYGKNIHISGLKDNIKKLFIITGLDKLFLIEE